IGLGVIAVLVAVLVPNAYFIQSVQERPRGRPAETDPDDVLKARKRLGQAVTFKTVSAKPDSGPEFDKLKDFLTTEFHLLLSDPRVTVETISDRSLLVTWKGSDPSLPGVLLTAHLDVVPAEYEPSDKPSPETKGWDHDPFKDAGLDGVIWGRGTLDDKVSVLAILEAAEGLLRRGARPVRTLYFGFGQDEEVGGKNGATQCACTTNFLPIGRFWSVENARRRVRNPPSARGLHDHRWTGSPRSGSADLGLPGGPGARERWQRVHGWWRNGGGGLWRGRDGGGGL